MAYTAIFDARIFEKHGRILFVSRPLFTERFNAGEGCTRRSFLVAATTFLAGCQSASPSGSRVVMPGASWLEEDFLNKRSPTRKAGVEKNKEGSIGSIGTKKNLSISIDILKNAISRKQWAEGKVLKRDLKRLGKPRYLTLHHDALTKDSFVDYSFRGCAARLEMIRYAHVKRGWADIGYHYAIDPAGRIWECRPLIWQGAHVKYRNPSNIGIVVLGNFEIQRPNTVQLEAISDIFQELMRKYEIARNRVFTHREWPNAATACPGKNLQPRFEQLRHRFA